MMVHGLRPETTTRTYSVGQRAWARWTFLYGQPFWLVPFGGVHSVLEAEDVVMMFVLWLHRSVQATTPAAYCTAVRDLHVRAFGEAPFDRVARLPLLLKKLRRDDALARRGEVPLVKRRITAEMLHGVSGFLGNTAGYFDFLIFTMMLTAFHGLLRVAEFTVRDQRVGFQSERDLVWSKVRFYPAAAARDSSVAPEYVCIDLGVCKGNMYASQYVYIHRADDSAMCAVQRLHRLRHWRRRGRRPRLADPVFALSGGAVVYRRTFAKGMCHLLAAACGGDFKGYGTHSLRRGGAQALTDAGAPPWVVQLMGRWSSDAYRRYCETDLRQLLRWTTAMGHPRPDALHHDD